MSITSFQVVTDATLGQDLMIGAENHPKSLATIGPFGQRNDYSIRKQHKEIQHG
ncbi:hypothetical protein K26PH128C1_LOCUS40 [Klebsiella phage vB_Ko_K26PH128C1]|uniref:Uncharacterized protein n=1 Tax=Klebsiella phage vB_Ko_K26PH128C1 TaxID=3071634 RepID=A0AAV1MFH6_9CAUD|nr:hypothetical protein K26PH128C1_LOCUS40 [Klebsiella phage vB_Ko_K26PH128C1]